MLKEEEKKLVHVSFVSGQVSQDHQLRALGFRNILIMEDTI